MALPGSSAFRSCSAGAKSVDWHDNKSGLALLLSLVLFKQLSKSGDDAAVFKYFFFSS